MFKNPLFRNGEENEKVIWNPHTDPDHHQKLITSRGSRLAHVCQVWSTSACADSPSAYREFTEWQNDRM